MCDYAPNREAAMVVLERDAGGKPTVWCDPCITPVVRALNAGELRTVASCCGHDHAPGWIMLADGRTLILASNEWGQKIADFAHGLVGCKPGFECSNCISGGVA